ncbi:uncharacterized protein AB675_4740 [Cyphellophora attinorum]|uniref:Carboxymethylenebutenolidase n=1 Tax=Cyphellophora attinorum TaxID=1664694 RepID=A0A0N1NY92_9EURO|nr:uncharacterized protein AB675_4740 [Phialophora attinorum]KPI35644.1 hypothetical protein AB675_4740 [Phialophora attinorum]
MGMFNDITKPAPPLPRTTAKEIQPDIKLLHPLTRRGSGPGLIVLLPSKDDFLSITDGVPSIPVKWAEEGYTVVGVSDLGDDVKATLKTALDALEACHECSPKEKVGLVSYNPSLWEKAAPVLEAFPSIAGAVVYNDLADKEKVASSPVPTLTHLAGEGEGSPIPQRHGKNITYTYTNKFLKPLMYGPYFDLEIIWEEHTYYEFADRSVEHTMSTMVQEPYVNHVPTLTGGIGRSELSKFYAHNFIFNNSEDTSLDLLSRTLGIDRIVDEFIFSFTHDKELDWLLPGVPPTHRKVSVPFTAIVNVRGTVLAQLGLLPEYLPFPYPLPDAKDAEPRKKVEYRVPVEGINSAKKMQDRNSVQSNMMFQYKIRELD